MKGSLETISGIAPKAVPRQMLMQTATPPETVNEANGGASAAAGGAAVAGAVAAQVEERATVNRPLAAL